MSEFLAPGGRVGFTNIIALDNAGWIDFVVGPGSDNNPYGSMLKLFAAISGTTNPATYSNTNVPPPPASTNQGRVVALWHGDAELRGVDAVILPGGFSYGDYLRCGAISRFAPVMSEVVAAAQRGMPVLGICNGFQILCESHLLPGALIRNDHRTFICRDQRLRIENNRTPWTSSYVENAEVTIVLKNGEGGFIADEATLERLEGEGRVVARYLGVNPNGSLHDIAGISSERGNVVGLMPHPEHAVEELTGAGTDGLGFFTGLAALGVGA